ncbi:MAG TPA: N-acetyltransferase [Ktedonobacterales bacterium]|nr:N-acetyltransferase [Ktedonobacterales bacterium]
MTTQPEPPLIVRRATSDDRRAALSLISPSSGRGRASLSLLRAQQGILWVAVERAGGAAAGDETLVGLLLATAQVDAEEETVVGYIHELLVHPAYRRRGVAMELLDAAERYFLVECAFGMVSVTTSFDNDAAIRLYRSRGYSLSQARLAKRRDETPSSDGAER